MIGGNIASITAGQIVCSFLKSKDRKLRAKQDDRKSSRMAMTGRYSKGSDGQICTSSPIFLTCILILINKINCDFI